MACVLILLNGLAQQHSTQSVPNQQAIKLLNKVLGS